MASQFVMILVDREISAGSVNHPHTSKRYYPQYPVMLNPLQMGMEPVTISNGKVNEAFEPDWNVESPLQYNGVKTEVQVSPKAFQFVIYAILPVIRFLEELLCIGDFFATRKSVR